VTFVQNHIILSFSISVNGDIVLLCSFFITYELFAQDERCTVIHIYSKVFEKGAQSCIKHEL